ncbi:MAG: hypothetical protein IKZ09_11050 [Clostridia bacterium]|nr:hypothetical protein [Clostridia bacterium]
MRKMSAKAPPDAKNKRAVSPQIRHRPLLSDSHRCPRAHTFCGRNAVSHPMPLYAMAPCEVSMTAYSQYGTPAHL